MNQQINLSTSHPTHQQDLLDYSAGEMAEELTKARARIRELEAQQEIWRGTTENALHMRRVEAEHCEAAESERMHIDGLYNKALEDLDALRAELDATEARNAAQVDKLMAAIGRQNAALQQIDRECSHYRGDGCEAIRSIARHGIAVIE